ncbi:hypothetical protein [Streptomyces griseoluteus]|uniref:hypothetical protein n=1 Tax=Streptomyces griseoluteus TaxID=29306 RepID=UPI0037F2E0C8
MASATATPVPAKDDSGSLRRLYFLRFAFATVWAVLVFASARSLNPLSATLLVIYPLFDVACAVLDIRSAKANHGPVRGLYANVALSALTTAALVAAVTSGLPAVLRVWGAWAITAGAVQLIVGAVRSRRGMAGQWPMILSGAISTFAGASFAAQAAKANASLGALAGYAFLGGVFFLVSALRLRRQSDRAERLGV